MNGRNPFLLVPWQEDFLGALAARALEDTDGRMDRAAFVFPHARPMRYMSLLLRDTPGLPKPLLMPRMYTLTGLFSELAARSLSRPARPAGQLDRVALLLACVRAEAEKRDAPFQPFLLDAPSFFPWGLRLDALFEECLVQCRTPGNFLHAEDSVSPYAAMLLSRLGSLFARYTGALAEREWTSPGFDAWLAARALEAGGGLPESLLAAAGTGRAVYIAGFHLLSGAEERLFKKAWAEAGATIVIQADPALAGGGAPHWSCEAFARWAANWGTRIEALGPPAACHAGSRPFYADEAGKKQPRPRFVAAYDLHSQLARLREELRSGPGGPEGNNAVDGAGNDGASGQGDAVGGRATLGAVGGARENDAFPGPGENSEKDHGAVSGPLPGVGHRADTAVILPSGELLMPVLHHLPDRDVNISMGYPLARSPLFQLLDTLGRLQEGRKGRAYYWRDLVDLLRHPYIKMLRPCNQDDSQNDSRDGNGDGNGDDYREDNREGDRTAPGDSLALRRLLHSLERELRGRGRAYAEPQELLRELAALGEDPERHESPEQNGEQEQTGAANFLALLFERCFTAFEKAQSSRMLAAALEGLCLLLVRHGARLWERFPIDAECLYRLRQSVIPELAAVDFGEEAFPPQRLYSMLRALLQSQRVPFEAEPLVGLQVLGMLESRLLSFRRVIVVDASEERLPGSPTGDPLLPEALRPELGLPPAAAREQAVAYNFFRLLHGADQSLLLWSENSEAPGIREMKSGRSRFVQELLWREEKRAGRLLAAQGRDGPLETLSAAVSPVRRSDRFVRVTGAVRDLLDDLALRPLSASLLDSYLLCPARFFYERLLHLAPAEEVREGDDPLAVGDLLHQCLENTYARLLDASAGPLLPGELLPGGRELVDMLEEELTGNFLRSSAFAALEARLPADGAAMLREAGVKRLRDYLLRQPPTRVLAAELPLNALFRVQGRDFRLTGKADRVDARPLPHAPDETALVIVDYKSGHVPDLAAGLWKDESFWRSVAEMRPRRDRGEDFLQRAAARLPSVQLPLYLLLASLSAETQGLPGLPVGNALWVALGADGGERPLLPENLPPEAHAKALNEYIPAFLSGLLRHLFESDRFCPRRGPHCGWCSCQKSCMSFL